jgi:hypothetical protein
MKQIIPLNIIEIKLIDRFRLGELSLEDLESGISRKLELQESIELIDFYLNKKDYLNFDRVLWLMPKSYSKDEKLKLFSKYLLDNRHEEHEEMIGVLFDYTNDKQNISLLKTLIENTPRYFYDLEREYVFIKKCLKIIQKYDFPETYEAIESIYNNSDDKTIKIMTKYILDNKK